MRGLVHFRGTVCNSGRCARQLGNKIRGLGNVSFIETVWHAKLGVFNLLLIREHYSLLWE